MEVEEVAKKGRHVRDIWDQAEVSERFRRVGIKVGSFLITRRKYEYDDGKKIEVAGHIGLITDVTEETIVWIHASPPIGRVEERQLKTAATIMGAVEYLEAA